MTAQPTVTIEGRVLTKSVKAIKLWTPIGDFWIPFSQILDCDSDLDAIEEHEEITIEIPEWLARKNGLAE